MKPLPKMCSAVRQNSTNLTKIRSAPGNVHHHAGQTTKISCTSDSVDVWMRQGRKEAHTLCNAQYQVSAKVQVLECSRCRCFDLPEQIHNRALESFAHHPSIRTSRHLVKGLGFRVSEPTSGQGFRFYGFGFGSRHLGKGSGFRV